MIFKRKSRFFNTKRSAKKVSLSKHDFQSTAYTSLSGDELATENGWTCIGAPMKKEDVPVAPTLYLDESATKHVKAKKKKINVSLPIKAVLTSVCIFSLVFALLLNGDFIFEKGIKLGLISAGMIAPESAAELFSPWENADPNVENNHSSLFGTDSQNKPTQNGDNYTISAGGTQQLDSEQISANPPPEAGNGGKIIEEQFTSGNNHIEGVAIRNNSSRTIDVAAEVKQNPNLEFNGSSEPQVLIVHTHTTEGYLLYDAGYYNASDLPRTLDNEKNVVAIGDAITQQLTAAGIGVIHDTTVHDNPQYTGAYQRSELTVKKQLEAHPTIKIVLDIHRDSMMRNETTKVKPTVTINGGKAAQMMIIASTADTESNPHPNWNENVRFAFILQKALHTKYAGIMRPVYLVDSRYNQHLSKGALIVEVGSEANTLDEAVYSGQILGKTLVEELKSLQM